MNDNQVEYSENEEELFEHYRIQADPGQEPLRIDKFLMDRIPNTSRTKLQDAAIEGNIRVNDKKVKANYKVKPSDDIAIVLPYPKREIELIPEDIPLEILYEDDYMIILNKAANMVVHPGYGNYSGTMVNALIHHFDNLPEAKGAITGRPGLLHRPEKNHRGMRVIATTETYI